MTSKSLDPRSKPKVRFTVHPVAGNDDINHHLLCPDSSNRRESHLVEWREPELRYAFRPMMDVCGVKAWPIDVTLTNRAGMTSRYVVGVRR